ncbi:helix-turn-helix domain-containing protein [Flavobacterium foetidum]|uniref:helix-turn-helix domain-containing protein n=1 Tax=Flavobacterium foetidum TaxID=2026681 RepID=UPI0010753510|nr:helix-turn-helix domain-containing protein [Flavobacterium foetidum]KAF2514900.1 helix-turn-helix domain-containing protein [Flavobacterium foetidum]
MILIRFFNIYLLLLVSVCVSAQESKKELIELTYNQLNKLYFENQNNASKQLLFSNAYMAKAEKENNKIRIARANYLMALLYYKTDKETAIKYLDSVIKYSKNSGDKYFPTAAYCEKADFLKKQFKFKEAMDNYKLAEKTALKTNIDYYYVVRNYIGTAKSEDLGEYKEALEIYRECYDYYKTKDFRSQEYASEYQDVIFGLADCYKSLQNVDSTTYYNKLGFKESTITRNEYLRSVFMLNEGANQVLRKNYPAALDSINNALPQMIKDNDMGNILAAYFYLGKTYEGLGKKESAVDNYLKVDSIYLKTNEITEEFTDGYPYLIAYYKNKGDKENQLRYISKFMSINNLLQKKYRSFNKLVKNEYDIPHLISDKENLITSLKREKVNFYWGIGTLVLGIMAISVFGTYQFQLTKKYRIRFEKLMRESTIKDLPKTSNELKQNKINDSKNEEIGIGEELILQILEKLNCFEQEKGFLKSDISVQSLSALFQTNSKYLSKIVNTYRNKTFVQYINDLRVECAIENLKKDKKLRKYTIQALALEFGFNNSESFSAAFYKKSGLKPTYFIKHVEELQKK